MCIDLDLGSYIKGQGHTRTSHARVHVITYLCINGLPDHLVQILSSLRRCPLTMTWVNTSKVKVTQDI